MGSSNLGLEFLREVSDTPRTQLTPVLRESSETSEVESGGSVRISLELGWSKASWSAVGQTSEDSCVQSR